MQWFFVRLKAIYAGRYFRTWPDDESVNASKREWAADITRYSQDKLDMAFESVRDDLKSGRDEAKWPDPAYVLGKCRSSW